MQSLLVVGLNILLGAALWGIGMLLRKRRNTIVGEIQDREVQTSAYGLVKPILYGEVKQGLKVIHTMDLTPYPVEEGGGKAGSVTQMYYLATWAGILGIEPDQSVFGNHVVVKVWVDEKLAYNASGDGEEVKQGPWWSMKARYYDGSSSQTQDPTLTSFYSAYGNPAYRYRPLVVIKDLNVTYFGNRIPTIRCLLTTGALISGGVYQVTNFTHSFPDGVGAQIGSDYTLSQVISLDEQFIVSGYAWTPESASLGDAAYTWRKIDTSTREVVAEKTYYNTDADMEQYCGVSTNIPWYYWQAIDMDETGNVYALLCEGYGKVSMLDSNTFTVQSVSPSRPPGEDYQLEKIMVSKNPLYPYLWSWYTGTGTEEDTIWLQNRSTLASPFNSSEFGFKITHPLSGTDENPKIIGATVDNSNGSLIVIWSTEGELADSTVDNRTWVARYYPDGSQDLEEVTGILPTAISPNDFVPNAVTYDPGSGQLAYYAEDKIQFLDIDGSVTTYNGGISGISVSDYGAMDWQRGPVNGNLYITDNEAGKVYRVDMAERAAYEMYDISDYLDSDGNLIGGVYITYRDSMYINARVGDVDMQEITFDIVQSTGVSLGAIVYDICRRAGLADSEIDVSDLYDVPVRGYSVDQDQSAREALEPLMEVFVFDAVDQDGRLTFVRRGGASKATIPEYDLGVFMHGGDRPQPLEIEYPEETELPWKMEVHYADVDYKHESRVQSWERQATDSRKIEKIQSPVLMNSNEAKQLAHIAMRYAWNCFACSFSLGPKYAYLMPTDVIMISRTEGLYRVLLLEVQRQGLLTKWTGVIEGVVYY